MKKLLFLLLALFATQGWASQCPENVVIEGDKPTQYAAKYRSSYKGPVANSSTSSISQTEALSIARDHDNTNDKAKFAGVFVDGLWVIYYSRCDKNFFGGSGMMLVDPKEKKVIQYSGDKENCVGWGCV